MTDTQKPWYKEPYVWMLIGFPLSSVIVGIFFITTAVVNQDSLVRDNYYKDGLAYNSELQWDKQADALDVRLNLLIEGNNLTLNILNSRKNPPSTLKVSLGHPTIPEKDRASHLQLKEAKRFIGFIDDIEDGRYYLLVECPEQEWRVRKDIWVKNGVLTAI
ncbi:FixH family protein [Oceaniserpentilla sp. 4NH20-0058]|uniref:FixH family protein n=1 Tax=Oceaniserpentilla sp. 4NH20-0058 TaxID=3127660 RepID=UPI00310965E7